MNQFQLTQTPFRFGLADGDSPHAVPFGVLTECENYRWEKGGRLQKRWGVDLIAQNVSSIERLLVRDNELCSIGGLLNNNPVLYSHYTNVWRSVGRVPDVGLTWQTLMDMTTGAASSDTAVTSTGIAVHAWVSGDPFSSGYSVNYQVKDLSTGALLVPPTRIEQASPAGIRVLVIGTTVGIFFRRDAATPYDVRGYTFDTLGLALSAGATLVSDVTGTGVFGAWDMAVINGEFALAYNAAFNVTTLKAYDTALNNTATGTCSDAVGSNLVSLAGSGSLIYLVYLRIGAAPAPIRFAVFDATYTETVAPVTIETPPAASLTYWVGVEVYDGTQALAMYHVQEPTLERTMSYLITGAGAVVTNSERGQWATRMITRPFMMGGRAWAYVCDYSIPYVPGTKLYANNVSLVEIETSDITPPGSSQYVPWRYVGMTELLVGGHWQLYQPPSGVTVYGEHTYANLPFQSEVAQLSNLNWKQGVKLAKVSTTNFPRGLWDHSLSGREVYVAGATLSAYDGARVFDYGFPRAPWFRLTTALAGAPGQMATGSYIYSGVFEFPSRAGVLHRSPTMIASTIAVTGPNGRVQLEASGHNATRKTDQSTGWGVDAASPYIFAPYRSVVNDTELRRLAYNPGYNFTTADARTADSDVLDTRADSDITGNGEPELAIRPVIYTTGGVLDDYAPVAQVTMFEHADRLWTLAGDELTWWYSKTFQDDVGVAPGFHPDFRIVFTDKQIAGCSVDSWAAFFSEDGISYIEGVGPAPNGEGSDFQGPFKLQTDVGCTNARSVVSMPLGVMFQSVRGIHLLDRGKAITWIGKPVRDKLEAYPVITSAVLVPNCNEVRFTCNNTARTAGIVLAYNYVEKQWSTAKYNDGTTYGCAIADAIYHNDRYHFVTTGGLTYRETTLHCRDNQAYVPGLLETAWVSAAGPLAFHSCRNFELQGVSQSAHNLTIDVAFDSNTTYQQTRTFDADSDVTAVGPLEECRIHIGTRRKCMSIRFRVTDTTPSGANVVGTGMGPYFETMSLEYAILPGTSMSATKKG